MSRNTDRLVVVGRIELGAVSALQGKVALGVDDQTRAEKALKGISGKRVTYRGPRSFEAPF